MDGERLTGGRTTGATRVGESVRKPVQPSTPAVHAVLRHLEAAGFDGAPRSFGTDDEGRQVLSHLPGETVGDRRPWPAWVHRAAPLVQVGAGRTPARGGAAQLVHGAVAVRTPR